MEADELRRLAIRQLADYDARTPGQLFSQPVHLTGTQAYALQTEVVRLREQRGEKVIGYKIGCTSKVIQRQLGVDQPIFGRLFASECFRSGARLSFASYANLAVEGEFAVRLARDLSGPDLSQEECLGAIAALFPVIELHHYVLHEARSRGPELIASNGMHAGFVLAEESGHCGPSELVQSLCIRINGVRVGAVEDSGTFARATESLRWLGGRLAGIGLGLDEGQIILTGSPMPLFPVSPGVRSSSRQPRWESVAQRLALSSKGERHTKLQRVSGRPGRAVVPDAPAQEITSSVIRRRSRTMPLWPDRRAGRDRH